MLARHFARFAPSGSGLPHGPQVKRLSHSRQSHGRTKEVRSEGRAQKIPIQQTIVVFMRFQKALVFARAFFMR